MYIQTIAIIMCTVWLRFHTACFALLRWDNCFEMNQGGEEYEKKDLLTMQKY